MKRPIPLQFARASTLPSRSEPHVMTLDETVRSVTMAISLWVDQFRHAVELANQAIGEFAVRWQAVRYEMRYEMDVILARRACHAMIDRLYWQALEDVDARYEEAFARLENSPLAGQSRNTP